MEDEIRENRDENDFKNTHSDEFNEHGLFSGKKNYT